MNNNTDIMESVIHEVNCKATNLKGAAVMLRKVTPAKRERLLNLMAQQAHYLAELLSRFQRQETKQP